MAAKRRVLLTSADAVPATKQHKKPCSDCPWSRRSVNGWLGNASSDQWVASAHSEARIECHTLVGAQCAGAAIYRANVLKKPRSPEILILAADRETVFDRPTAFKEHHAMAPVAFVEPSFVAEEPAYSALAMGPKRFANAHQQAWMDSMEGAIDRATDILSPDDYVDFLELLAERVSDRLAGARDDRRRRG